MSFTTFLFFGFFTLILLGWYLLPGRGQRLWLLAANIGTLVDAAYGGQNATPQTERSYRIPNVQPRNENYLYNLDYFRQLAELCQQEGIRCVFFLSPTMRDYTDEQTRCLLEDLGALPCEAVEDWTDLIEEIGIDNACDWYDTIHFNQRGAEKFTAFLSDYLLDLGLTPTPGADAALWQKRWDYLH